MWKIATWKIATWKIARRKFAERKFAEREVAERKFAEREVAERKFANKLWSHCQSSSHYAALIVLLLASATTPQVAAKVTFDVDGNGQAQALTDGVLILRSLFSFTGDNLTRGAVDEANCTRCDAAAVSAYLQELGFALDTDGDGERRPLTDGIQTLRFLFLFRNESLIRDAVVGGEGCLRCGAAELAAHLTALTEDVPDIDGDGLVAVLDDDDDGDGVADAQDAFPDDPAETADSDGNGIGNNAELAAGNNPFSNKTFVERDSASGDYETIHANRDGTRALKLFARAGVVRLLTLGPGPDGVLTETLSELQVAAPTIGASTTTKLVALPDASRAFIVRQVASTTQFFESFPLQGFPRGIRSDLLIVDIDAAGTATLTSTTSLPADLTPASLLAAPTGAGAGCARCTTIFVRDFLAFGELGAVSPSPPLAIDVDSGGTASILADEPQMPAQGFFVVPAWRPDGSRLYAAAVGGVQAYDRQPDGNLMVGALLATATGTQATRLFGVAVNGAGTEILAGYTGSTVEVPPAIVVGTLDGVGDITATRTVELPDLVDGMSTVTRILLTIGDTDDEAYLLMRRESTGPRRFDTQLARVTDLSGTGTVESSAFNTAYPGFSPTDFGRGGDSLFISSSAGAVQVRLDANGDLQSEHALLQAGEFAAYLPGTAGVVTNGDDTQIVHFGGAGGFSLGTLQIDATGTLGSGTVGTNLDTLSLGARGRYQRSPTREFLYGSAQGRFMPGQVLGVIGTAGGDLLPQTSPIFDATNAIIDGGLAFNADGSRAYAAVVADDNAIRVLAIDLAEDGTATVAQTFDVGRDALVSAPNNFLAGNLQVAISPGDDALFLIDSYIGQLDVLPLANGLVQPSATTFTDARLVGERIELLVDATGTHAIAVTLRERIQTTTTELRVPGPGDVGAIVTIDLGTTPPVVANAVDTASLGERLGGIFRGATHPHLLDGDRELVMAGVVETDDGLVTNALRFARDEAGVLALIGILDTPALDGVRSIHESATGRLLLVSNDVTTTVFQRIDE